MEGVSAEEGMCKEGGCLRRPNQRREGQEGPTHRVYHSGNQLKSHDRDANAE